MFPKYLLAPGLALLYFCIPHPASGQIIDPGFQPQVTEMTFVNSLAVQPNGRILAAGGFDYANGQWREGLARFLPDGSLDHSLSIDPNLSFRAQDACLMPDGRIACAGVFSYYGGDTLPPVLILNPDGALSPAFQWDGSWRGEAYKVACTEDGRIIAAGQFAQENTGEEAGLLKLNTSGEVEASAGFTFRRNYYNQIALFPDGSLLAAFYSDLFAEVGLEKFTSALDPDPGFDFPTLDSLSMLYSLRINDEGYIALGAGFDFDDYYLLTLSPGGEVLSRQSAPFPAAVMGTHPDGRFIVLNWIEGDNGWKFHLLEPHGAPQEPLYPAQEDLETFGLNDFHYFPDGQAVLCGWFEALRGQDAPGIGMLSSNGEVNTGFQASLRAMADIRTALPLPGGDILIGGTFNRVNGERVLPLAKLHPDGSLDENFRPAANPIPPSATALMPGGRLAVAFENGDVRLYFEDGSEDGSFDCNINLLIGSIQEIIPLPGGGLLLHGAFSARENGVPAGANLIRLNADGSVDFSLTDNLRAQSLGAVAREPDGALLLLNNAGGPILYNQQIVPDFIRLLPDGTLDPDFAPGFTAVEGDSYQQVELLPDGRMYIIGDFTTFNGQPTARGLVRLMPDGAVDDSFEPLSGFDNPGGAWPPFFTYSSSAYPDGSLILSGRHYDTYDGYAIGPPVLINSDGSLNTAFNGLRPKFYPRHRAAGQDTLYLFGFSYYQEAPATPAISRMILDRTLPASQVPEAAPAIVAPNPAGANTRFWLPEGRQGQVKLSLFDGNGRLLRRWETQITAEGIKVPLSSLPAGAYTVAARQGERQWQGRVVKY